MLRWLPLVVVVTACRFGFDGSGIGTDAAGEGDGNTDGGTPLVAPRLVTASDSGACAILSDNSLWCWGNNVSYGLGGATLGVQAPTQIGSDLDWAQVAPSVAHSCARKLDGSLWCWGDGTSGRLGTGDAMPRMTPTRVGTDSDWTDISAGVQNGCGLRGGALHCWGFAAWGTVGDGSTTTTRLAPVPVAAGTQFTDVTSSGYHACALDVDGGLWCWGLGSNGQLGNGSTTQTNPLPLHIGTDTWLAISTGANMTCGVKSDGTLWAWGMFVGATPIQVGTATGFRAVTCGEDTDRSWHVCGLRGSELWCAGPNTRGELALGNTTDVPIATPAQVEPGRTFDQVAAGDGFTCVIRDEIVVCSGLTDLGQLGDGFAATSRVPVPVSGAWSSFDTGYIFTAAIAVDDGSQWAWGGNSYRQLGTTSPQFHGTTTPMQTNTTPAWMNVSASFHGTLAIASNSTMWRMGGQFFMQGGAMLHQVPTSLETGTWLVTDGGAFHDCGIQADNSLWCWGTCTSGQCGTGNTTSSGSTPLKISATNVFYAKVSAGYDASCAIRTNGTLWCWGANGGKLGDGTTMQRLSPTQVGTATTWDQVAIGLDKACGIRTDDSLWCWGASPGNGSSTTVLSPIQIGTATWSHVAIGYTHACGVQTNGSLWCWGNNDSGQLGDGTNDARLAPTRVGTANNWVRVAGGWGFTCAITSAGQISCWGTNRYGQLGNGTAWKTSFQAVVH